MSYWVDRLDRQSENLYDITAAQIEKQLVKYYLSAQKEIQRDIERLYDILLKESGDGTVKINDLYKYNRYFELVNEINKKLTQLGQQEVKIYNQKLIMMYDGIQDLITHIAPAAISHSFVAVGTADEIVKSVWCSDGKHWSDRIWSNKKKLQELIEKGLVDSIVRGVPKDKTVETLKSTFGIGFSQADRITRTELSFVQNQSTLDRYSVAGVKRYKILAAKDERTSEICKKENGKIYDLDKAQVGVNMPPFHPNCRSTIVPILEV